MPNSIILKIRRFATSNISTYSLQLAILILPQTTVNINLKVKPDKWWQRPFIGGGRVINFNIDLADSQELLIPNNNLPGVLIWEARPWWQFLPFLLLALLGIGATGYLIWWVLFRTPPALKIVEFYPEDSNYEAINGDVVHLGWRINDTVPLQTIKIVGMSAEGKPLTRPEEYDFSKGLPGVLQSNCQQKQNVLTCRNVRTSARKAANYFFEITAISKPGRGAVSETRKSNPVAILPIPQPQVMALNSIQPIYQEVSEIAEAKLLGKGKEEQSQAKKADFEIRLNWSVTNPTQLKAVQLVVRTPEGLVVSPTKTYDFSQEIPTELKKFCKLGEELVCKSVKTGMKKPGDYIYSLTAIPKSDVPQKLEAKPTELIKVLPRPPRIIEFRIKGFQDFWV